MHCFNLLAENYCVVSFNETSIVVAELLSDVVSSGVDLGLLLLHLESHIVVLTHAVLVSPEFPNERPVFALLTLTFPA